MDGSGLGLFGPAPVLNFTSYFRCHAGRQLPYSTPCALLVGRQGAFRECILQYRKEARCGSAGTRPILTITANFIQLSVAKQVIA